MKTDNEIRISQTVRTYGTGSIVDFPNLSLMMMSPDLQEFVWGFDEDEGKFARKKVYDKRLQNLLGVDYFVLPPIDVNAYVGVRSVQFPATCYCPSCKTIFNIHELNSHYPLYAKDVEENRNGAWFCVKCINEKNNPKYTLIPSRFIIATEYGLIDDFPWDWYCHRDEKHRLNRILGGDGKCAKAKNNHHLKLEFNGVALSEIFVKCTVCGAKQSLGPIFDTESPVLMMPMNYLMNRYGKLSAPWKGVIKSKFWEEEIYVRPDLKDSYRSSIKADQVKHIKKYFPRVLQRGAGNVYFPVNYVGFVLPKSFKAHRDENEEQKAEFNKVLDMFIKINKANLGSIGDSIIEKSEIALQKLGDKIDAFCSAAGYDSGEFIEFLNNNLDDSVDYLEEKSEISRRDEFHCFTQNKENASREEWFKNDIRKVDKDSYPELADFLDNVVIIHQVKQLNILKGFTRVRPLAFEELILAQDVREAGNKAEEYRRIMDVRRYPKTNWLPCSEVKGEGILLVFVNDVLEKWSNELSGISEKISARSKKLSNNYRKSLMEFDPNLSSNDVKDISPRYILLHTLSHLLINAISKECGYNAASLSEIIYCSKDEENKSERKMNGILIYTSTPDAEGSLGGLAQMGGEERLQKLFRSAVDEARWCSSDPICIETEHGQGFMGVNLASCYACSMVPETSCETMNRFLDRGLVVGTIEQPEIGFFNQF